MTITATLGMSVVMFPKERKLRFYNEKESGRNIFDAILQLQKSSQDPVSVWLLSSEQNEEGTFDQFVTTSGEIYRTEQLNSRMINVARNFIKNLDENLLLNSLSGLFSVICITCPL